jgi:hypothetical protein
MTTCIIFHYEWQACFLTMHANIVIHHAWQACIIYLAWLAYIYIFLFNWLDKFLSLSLNVELVILIMHDKLVMMSTQTRISYSSVIELLIISRSRYNYWLLGIEFPFVTSGLQKV